MKKLFSSSFISVLNLAFKLSLISVWVIYLFSFATLGTALSDVLHAWESEFQESKNIF